MSTLTKVQFCIVLGVTALLGAVFLSLFESVPKAIEEGFSGSGAAATCGAAGDCYDIDVDLGDTASMQRGVGVFANYCLGCHSAKHHRFEFVSRDYDIPPSVMRDLLQFSSATKLSDHMTSSMTRVDGEAWFGKSPPDLTLVARSRSPEWLYTYMMTFYSSPKKTFGSDNLVFPNVGMPHVLSHLQGEQRLVCADRPQITANGGYRADPITSEPILGETCGVLETVPGSGLLNEDEYDQLIRDLVHFLTYLAEPEAATSHRIGGFVLLYLVVFTALAWLLYREFHKDVERGDA